MVVAVGPRYLMFNALGEGCLCLLKRFLYLSIRRLFNLEFMKNIYGKNATRTFLGAFFLAPIPFKQYQNRSGCSTTCFLINR